MRYVATWQPFRRFDVALRKACLDACQGASELTHNSVVEGASALFAPDLRVPSHFLVCLFHMEDKRFLLHPGVDPIALIRAVAANSLGTGTLQGASTITQQLHNVRQEARGVRRKRTLLSKLSQAIWALRTETRESKHKILREYLDNIYWGRSYYGIDAAVSGYLGTSREQLTVAQSFFLVDRLASPNTIITNRMKSLLKRNFVPALFSQDPTAWKELIVIYDEHFSYGDELQSIVYELHQAAAV